MYPDEERGLFFVSTFLTLASGGWFNWHIRFVASLILAVLAACDGLTGGFFCAACDRDKRLRRVHVPRMLPGKEERAFSHFILSLNVTFIIARAQQDTKVEGLPVDIRGSS